MAEAMAVTSEVATEAAVAMEEAMVVVATEAVATEAAATEAVAMEAVTTEVAMEAVTMAEGVKES